MKFYYFTADWCSPCKATKPFIKEYDIIEIIDVDTNEGSKLAGKFNVRGVPTIIATADSNYVHDQLVGAFQRAKLAEFMRKNNASTS